MCDEQWKLEKYARWTSGNPERPDVKENQWTTHCGEKIFLMLTKEHHLVVKEESVIFENHSLWNAQAWIKAIARGDSMLFLIKLQNEARKFRVQFSSVSKPGVVACQEFVSSAKSYFSIKVDSNQTINSVAEAAATTSSCNEENMPPKDGAGSTTDCQRLPLASKNACEDEAAANPIGKLAEILRERGPLALPLAYQHTNVSDFDIDMVVRLCLTDSNFPAFVCQVEKCLNNIMAEGSVTCEEGDATTATLPGTPP